MFNVAACSADTPPGRRPGRPDPGGRDGTMFNVCLTQMK